MKKATLLLLLLFISFSGFAQFPESFEGGFPPANWLVINQQGPNVTWAHNQVGNPGQPAHTGTRAAYLNREIAGTGITEDWLVTPGFAAPVNAELKFWSRLTIGGNQGTVYEIRVSTTSQSDPAQFNVIQTWTETQINPSQEDYVEKTVPLTGIAAGQQVYVAFVMRGTGPNGDRWLIDDVNVVENCLDPVAAVPTTVTFNSATLTWSNPSGATQWEVEVVEATAAFTGVGVIYNGLPPYTASPLLPGTNYKYKVRAICAGNNPSDWSNTINFTTSFQAPANDECSAAIALTVNATNICTVSTPGTVNAATASAEANTCAGNDNDDVWYSFVATGPTHLINLNNVAGSTTDLFHVVYSGAGCGSLTQMYCSDPNSSTATGLTAGNTYFVRVYSYSATAQTTTYNICIGTPPPAPANDECAAAIVVPVNPDLTCANFVTGTIFSATASPEANTCGGTDDDDVWFEFVATNTAHTINLNNISGGTADLFHAVYSGNNCGALTQLYCSDPNNSIAGNLVPGQTYKVRVYSWTATANQTSVFDICIGTPPPPPANDECSAAIVAPVNPDLLCGATAAGTIAWATPSIESSTCAGTEDDDVWFEFVATSTSHTVGLLNVAGSVTDMMHAVYSGNNCGALTQMYCSDPNSSIAGGLTIGATYKVRVYSYTATGGQNTTFNLCIGTPPPPPANDQCSGAIVAPVNPTQVCTQTVSGTVAWSTASAEASTCAGTEDDDVWYVFTATNTSHLISLLNVAGSVTDMMHAVYSGNNCGALTQLYCSDPNNSTANNLTVGQTYYVRIYTYTGTSGQNTTFDLCIGTPPPPPANDDCAAATVVPVNPTNICAQTVPGTIYSATASPEASTCGGTDDDDVWFEFVATNTTHIISLLNITGGTTDLYHGLYAGDQCGSLTQLYCSDPNESIANNLVVGQTYKIRVYSWTATAGQTSSFSVCVGTPPPPPANDECANAIVAPVNNNSLCTQTTLGTIYSATASPQASGCAGTADDDVWYEFTATHTQHYIALLNEGGTALNTGNMVHALYTGDCGSLTQVYCSDPNNSIANNLVIGQTYKIRIYSNASTPQTFTFRLCIGVILTCANSESFCANADQGGVTFPGSIGVPNLGAVSCLSTTPNPTYYFLQIAESGNLQMNLSQTSFAGNPIDVDFIAYGPFASLDSGCENLTAANEVDCSYSASAVEPFTIPNALVGEYYIVLITNFNGTQGTINFTQPNFGSPGAGATDCTIVCTADLGPDQVLCGVTEYDLDANIINATSYTWFKDGILIPGATSQTYTATESGVYSVEVVKAACPTNPTDSMSLTLIPTINVADPATVTTCGDLGSGTVDLAALSAGILGALNPADYVVEYYPTQGDATAGTNQIDATVPFVTSSQTIYVRIESALLATCFDVVPLPIVVNTSANADISYAGSPFCSTETTGAVTVIGDTGGTFTASPVTGTTGTIVIDAATGTIDITASTAGTYTVTYAIAATPFCPAFSDTFEVVIFDAPTATISYDGSPYCSNGGTATVTHIGATGGTYSSAPGLIIDAATGDIDLAASTPDTYTVTYTTAATADCPSDQFTTQVTITALPVATIDYGTTPYCSNGGTATVNRTGAAGGTYTSTTGLIINSATGDIDLAASAPDTYTVTYTLPAGAGCTPVPATASITITALPIATFTYDSASYCVNFGSTIPVSFAPGAVGGTFSAPAGLAIDPITGQIDPSASTPNTTYRVTNTIAAANGCGVVTAFFDITIIDAPLPTFTLGSQYCQEDEDPLPSVTGVSGTFSATPAGLVINPVSGAIDLSASEPGIYEVRNTTEATAECASVYHAVMVEVSSTPVFVFTEGCEGNTYKLEVVETEESFDIDNATYTWTGPAEFVPPLFNTPEIEPTHIGEYTVTVTTPAGCINSLSFTVESTGCLIQKGISPGDAADNNSFDLTALNVTSISIFNRYGQEVFSYGPYTNQWIGQDNSGNELPTGTYFYSFERSNGETKTGWIYINRQN